MNFSDFTKMNMQDKAEKNVNLETNSNKENFAKKTFTETDVRKTYDELKDLNSDQLSERLFNEVAKQKQDGTFNYDMLSNSVDSIKGYLPEETYKNLKDILKTLKWTTVR